MPELYRPFTSSLRTRLLVITVFFVLLIEVCVFLPAIATFRQNFLDERLRAGELAALTLEQASGRRVSPEFEGDLLDGAGLYAVVVKRPDFTLILGSTTMPENVDADFNLSKMALGQLVMDALDVLQSDGNRTIRVMGKGHTRGTRFVEITLPELALYDALKDYASNILLISIAISLFTGILIYLALHWLVVRPMRRIKDHIVVFSRQPERANKLATTTRTDEIGVIERELGRMQEEVRLALGQKTRLAELGEAVSKINHDLRNILATAQLASDSLSHNEDERVRRTATRLMSAVSRAVALCERTMRHGTAGEPAPNQQQVKLAPIAQEIAEQLGLLDLTDFHFIADYDKDFELYADPDQLHRVLLNLCRNASEAQGNTGTIKLSAMHDTADGQTHIRVTDQGPGVPDKALPTLFKAFSSSNKAGGTGLGLAIARDIILAHGGQIGLESSGPDGTVFLICLPARDQKLSASVAKASPSNPPI